MCNCKGNTVTQEDMKKIAIAGGLLFAAWKFGPAPVRAGALAVAAGVIAKRVPYVRDVL
jgi:hypothetical protein